ncbi:hypothetical protein K3495_g8601 [Podosphaera aphanis]|nr:hypothetical protein K3495_g8601 [Podosphaera aphanis]
MADSSINHENARKYWRSIDPDVQGMLGGFAHISKIDLEGSRKFLAHFNVGEERKVKRAIDCGAGIGRITEGLLLSLAETVDIVDPIVKFTNQLIGKDGIGQIFNVGLEDWNPSGLKYELIWNQWCLGHLTDVQLLTYLEKCMKALAPDGLIIVKENMNTSQADTFDELDSSVTRTDEKFRQIFKQSGLKLKKTELQTGFPRELYPVRIYALVPGL